MKLRYYILGLLLFFGLAPLILAVVINLPLVIERTSLFYQKAYLQNLRADFRDLDQHLASRNEIIRLLAKLPDPGMILGTQEGEQETDLARARYTGWINQMLSDQGDIVQILFLDHRGQARFWLQRDPDDHQWHPTETPPAPPNPAFASAASKLKPGEVMVSRIRVNAANPDNDPRQLLTLQLASPIGEPTEPGGPTRGLLIMTIDVGGLAQYYRNTLWVHHSGSYLQPGQPISDQARAFSDFPDLKQVFADGKLALSKSADGAPFLWVPMFQTEDALPLWVGRPVDSSPIANFRDTLIVRVLSIVLILVLGVMAMARAIARRAEHFGRELTKGVQHILREEQPLNIRWRGPYEVRELGQQLNALSRSHAEHIASERQHIQELERSNRYKSEFLANVSHELRTPLNAILLLSKMLAERESGLHGEQRRQARVIHEASSDLRGLIDNILDISRIEAGQVTVSLEWVDLAEMLEELVSLTETIFSSKGLEIALDIGPDAARLIYSDRDKIRQILKNFLSNAAKFTHQGRVLIRCADGQDPRRPVSISVADTGIGIPPGKEQIIFDAFQQADGSTRRRYGGTGLGLSISRELAELLNGRISVRSSPGQGSCFTLELPLSLDPASFSSVEILEPREDESEPSLAALEVEQDSETTADLPINRQPETARSAGWILLCERDIQSLLDLTRRIESMGFRLQTAADIDEALETLEEEPDCCLMLLGALADPQATCDSISRLRATGGFKDLPLVIIAEPEETAAQDYLAAGASAALNKPLSTEALAALLENPPTQSTTG